MHILGIDIGGSAIKGGIVDTDSGQLISERYRLETPQPAKPKAMLDMMQEIVQHFNWNGLIGCGYPGVVKNQTILTAANLDKSWIGENLSARLQEKTGCNVWTLNDADAAGIAETHFTTHHMGVCMMITVGTGLGTALFVNKQLVPNLELGHLRLKNGKEAEKIASAAVKDKEKLTWKRWSKRFDKYLCTLQELLWVDTFIIGGGIADKSEKFLPYLTVPAQVCVAQQGNLAGIIGAALAAKLYTQ